MGRHIFQKKLVLLWSQCDHNVITLESQSFFSLKIKSQEVGGWGQSPHPMTTSGRLAKWQCLLAVWTRWARSCLIWFDFQEFLWAAQIVTSSPALPDNVSWPSGPATDHQPVNALQCFAPSLWGQIRRPTSYQYCGEQYLPLCSVLVKWRSFCAVPDNATNKTTVSTFSWVSIQYMRALWHPLFWFVGHSMVCDSGGNTGMGRGHEKRVFKAVIL